MTKAKQSGGDLVPHHCYFWIAHLTNGKIIPEYDFENQIHNKVKDLPINKIQKFSWYPVTLTMLVRVKKTFNEDLKISVSDKIYSLPIYLNRGERLRTHPVWRNILSFGGQVGCKTLYALFKNTKNGIEGFFINESGEKVEECP